MKAKEVDKLVYSVAEISEMLGVNKNRVYSFIKAGILPCIDVGHIVVRREDLAEFLENSRGLDVSQPDNVRKISAFSA